MGRLCPEAEVLTLGLGKLIIAWVSSAMSEIVQLSRFLV